LFVPTFHNFFAKDYWDAKYTEAQMQKISNMLARKNAGKLSRCTTDKFMLIPY